MIPLYNIFAIILLTRKDLSERFREVLLQYKVIPLKRKKEIHKKKNKKKNYIGETIKYMRRFFCC